MRASMSSLSTSTPSQSKMRRLGSGRFSTLRKVGPRCMSESLRPAHEMRMAGLLIQHEAERLPEPKMVGFAGLSRHEHESRWRGFAADSPLEERRFEPSVPPAKIEA